MTTVSGRILDAADVAQACQIMVSPLSTPFIYDNGTVIGSPTLVVVADGNGNYSFTVEPGVYLIAFALSPIISFRATIPSGGPFNISEVADVVPVTSVGEIVVDDFGTVVTDDSGVVPST